MSKKFFKFLRLLYKPWILLDFFIMRYLTYNYNSPYKIRDFIYKLRIKLIPRVEINQNVYKKKDLYNLKKDGILLGVKNLTSKEVEKLNQELTKFDKKSLYNSDGILSKEVFSSINLSENYFFLKLATNDSVIRLVSQYFGCIPTIQFLTSWNTYKNEEELNEMFFHMDHHGHKFLKLFFYLSDVVHSNGHHEYIKGTHNQPVFDLKIKRNDNSNNHLMTQILSKRKYGGDFAVNESIIKKFLKKDILKISGNSGYSFIEDTRGLHRGTILKAETFRTVFQVLYTPNNNYKDNTTKGNSLIAFDKVCEQSLLSKQILKRICSQILEF